MVTSPTALQGSSSSTSASRSGKSAPDARTRMKSAAPKSPTAVTKPASVKRKPPISAPKTGVVAAPATAKDAKPKKNKLVRDSFTIPKDEYTALALLKQRTIAMAQPAKKSELLRAGLMVLAGMPDTVLRTALQAVPSIKTGRPPSAPAMPSVAKTSPKTARG